MSTVQSSDRLHHCKDDIKTVKALALEIMEDVEEVEVLELRSFSPPETPTVKVLELATTDDGLDTISTRSESPGVRSVLCPESFSTPKTKKRMDTGTLTPSHWTSEAAEAEIGALRVQTYTLRDQLERCYEIEAHTNSYISTLKSRSRSVEETVERVREVEEVNRRLRRDLEYEFDDAVTRKQRIDFLERKLDILEQEKEALKSECENLRRQRDRAENDMVAQDRIISMAYRQKLEEEVKKIELFHKNELKRQELCGQCYSLISCPASNIVAVNSESPKLNTIPRTSLDSRTILMNPSHPSFEKLKSTSIEDLRRGRVPVKEVNARSIKIDERVEFTYYAQPMTPVNPARDRPRPKSSSASKDRPSSSVEKRRVESMDKYRKVTTVKRIKRS